MGEKLGRTAYAIKAKLQKLRHDKELKRERLGKDALTVDKKFGCWSDEEDGLLWRLKDEGLSWDVIGARLDRSPGAAQQRFWRLVKDQPRHPLGALLRLSSTASPSEKPLANVSDQHRQFSTMSRKTATRYTFRLQAGSLHSWNGMNPVTPFRLMARDSRRNYTSTPSCAKSWPQEDRDRLQELLGQGLSNAECAKELGKSELSVEMAIRRGSGVPGRTTYWDPADDVKLTALRDSGTPWCASSSAKPDVWCLANSLSLRHILKTEHWPQQTLIFLKKREANLRSTQHGTNRSHNKPWSTLEIETVVKLRDAGMSSRYTAKHLGRSVEAVRHARQRILDGEYEGDPVGAKTKRPTQRERWSAEEDEKLCQMRSERISWKTIGAHLGRTAAAAAERWKTFARYTNPLPMTENGKFCRIPAYPD